MEPGHHGALINLGLNGKAPNISCQQLRTIELNPNPSLPKMVGVSSQSCGGVAIRGTGICFVARCLPRY